MEWFDEVVRSHHVRKLDRAIAEVVMKLFEERLGDHGLSRKSWRRIELRDVVIEVLHAGHVLVDHRLKDVCVCASDLLGTK